MAHGNNPPGYGSGHRTMRARLINALPAPCIRCGQIIPAGIDPKMVQLDHYDTPIRDGGRAGEGALAHRACNARDGANITNSRRRKPDARTTPTTYAPVITDRHPDSFLSTSGNPAPLSSSRSGGDPDARLLPTDMEAAVLALPWVKAMGDMPRDERLPRIMSAAHPRAIGSFGAEWWDFCRDRLAWFPFWWQRLVAARVLEFDEDDQMVWLWSVLSTTRQVGKSALLRSLALFRVARPDLFGMSPQVSFIASTTLKLGTELMRPALAWADRTPEWRAYRGAMDTHVESSNGGRWLLGPANATHGFSVNFPMTDEAWGIDQTVVEDHMEPTMLAADRPQFVIASTAHPRATLYVPNKRAQGMDEMFAPEDMLILEWSVDRVFDDIMDERLWRVASPRWTGQRQRLLRSKATAPGVNAAAFRTQYLNQWPEVGELTARPVLADPVLYARSQGQGATGLGDPLVVAVEDHFGVEGSVAVAEVRAGRVHVTGQTFESRTAAWDYVDAFLHTYGQHAVDVRFLVGASLGSDPRLETMPVSVDLRGARETRQAIGLYRSLLRDGVVAHDVDAPDLAVQMLAARVMTTSSTGARFDESERHDLASAVIWAVQEAAQAFGMVPEADEGVDE